MSKSSVCDMKVLPNGFFPQSYPKESHHNLNIVKGKVGKWQQGHEKFTYTGKYSWHLRKISFPSASWYIFPYTQLYWSRQATEMPQHCHMPTGKVSFWTPSASLCSWHESSFCHWDFSKGPIHGIKEKRLCNFQMNISIQIMWFLQCTQVLSLQPMLHFLNPTPATSITYPTLPVH